MNTVETMPTELQLVSPPTMPQARSYRSSFLSDLQEYDVTRGNMIKINIPRLQRSYLDKDTYLQFRVSLDLNTGAFKNCLALDRSGAYSLFDRMEVYDYLGGTLLEQTNQLAPLITVLNDVHHEYTDLNSTAAAVEGFEAAGVAFGTNTTSADYLELRSTPSGKYFGLETAGAKADRCWALDLALRLPSFLGMFSDKLCPLHNGFTINLYLNSPEQALVARQFGADANADTAVATDLAIKSAWLSNVQLNSSILELGDTAESLLMSTQPWVIHSRQFRNFRDNIKAGTSYQRLDLNLNVVSLRNIYAIQRPWTYQNSISFPSNGERIRNYLQRFNFQYGSSFLPEVNGVLCRGDRADISRNGFPTGDLKSANNAAAYFEVVRSSRIRMPSINSSEFSKDVPDAIPPFGNTNKTFNGKFLACLNTQLTPKSIISGLDTNGLMVGLNFDFDQDQLNAQVDAILDVWAEHDTFIQIIPGVASTVTF